jgi:hypothetical protein
MHGDDQDSGAAGGVDQRGDGSRAENSMRCGRPETPAARIASISSGMRSAIEAGSPRRSAGAVAEACALKAMTRPSRPITTTGSGIPETTASSRATPADSRTRSLVARAASAAC